MPLPPPIALCLEDLDAASDARRYLQCVAVAGGTPGLTVDPRGRADWRQPEHVAFETPQATVVVVRGIDKQVVGEVAAKVRATRPPEPYKGKGIRYAGEFVQRKVGKRA